MHDVFISYKSDDSALAMKVVKALEENGIPCWIAERNIRAGSNYAMDIPSAIREATFFVLILTEKSQESPWVLKELDAAITQRKMILPLMVGSFQINDAMNFLITGVQYYDATNNLNRTVKQIIQQIQEVNAARQTEETVLQTMESPSNAEEVLDKILGATKGLAESIKKRMDETTTSDKEETAVSSSEVQKETVPAVENETKEPAGVTCSLCGSSNVTERGGEGGCGSGILIFIATGLIFILVLFFCIMLDMSALAVLGVASVVSVLVFVLLVHQFSHSETYWFCNTCGRIFVPEEKEELK